MTACSTTTAVRGDQVPGASMDTPRGMARGEIAAMPAPHLRDLDEQAAAAQLDISLPALRRFHRLGGIEASSAPGLPLRFRLAPGETHLTLCRRLVADAEIPEDRPSALRLRNQMACLDGRLQVRYPRRLEDAGVALAVATGLGLTRDTLRAVLRGTAKYLDGIITRAANEGVRTEATRQPSVPSVPPPGERNLTVGQAAEQLGIRGNRILRLCGVGRLRVVSGEGEPPLVRLAEGETRQTLLRRILADAPVPFNRAAAIRYRDEISCLDPNTSVRYLAGTEDAAVALLTSEGLEPDLANLRALLWGEAHYINRIIRRKAAAAADAARRAQPLPVPPEGLHDVPLTRAAHQMGISFGAVRRLCGTGEFEFVSYPDEPARVRLPFGATRASVLAKLLASPPEPFDRAAAESYRERIACLDRGQRARFTPAVEDMAVAILRSEGATINRDGLRPLLWGPHAYLDRIVLHANREPSDTICQTSLCAEAGIGRRATSLAVALGVITEGERGPRNVHRYEFREPPSRATLSALLVALAPAARGKTMFKQYAGLRSALGWAALDDHPAGILEDTADYLRSRGQQANVASILRILRGNREQIAEFLVGYNERHRLNVHVKRTRGHRDEQMTLRQFVDRLDPQLRQPWGTALDTTRGSTTDAPTDLDLRYLGAITDDRMFQPAAMITLHARRLKKVPERRLHAALRAMRNLEEDLDGEFGSTTIVGAVLSAWVELPGPDASLRPRLTDATGWKHAVALFAGFVKRLPAAERPAALANRIAPPAGSVGFYRHIEKQKRVIDEDALGDKAERLEDLLNDPQRLLNLVLQTRDRTRALRDSVLAKRDESISLGVKWPASGSMPEDFTEVATARRIVQRAAYEIHRWTDVHERLVAAGVLAPDELPGPSGLAVPEHEAHLFEHNYVVAGYRCVPASGSEAAPLAFVGQFETGMFHPFGQADEDATDAMMQMMAGCGLTMTDRAPPSGLWAFEGPGRRRLALLAHQHLGLTLLPISEVDHGQQYATLAMSTNFDWPTRPAELLQHRLDEGKFRIYREKGIPGPILSYKAVRKFGQHFGAGEDDFYMFEGSIKLQRELLGTTRSRLVGGGGIPVSDAPRHFHAKGIFSGNFVYSTKRGVMREGALTILINLMLAGTARVKLRDGKELWTALSRRAGLSTELRQRASRHVSPSTTLGYGAETALEIDNLYHELAKARAIASGVSLRVVSNAPARVVEPEAAKPAAEADLETLVAAELAVALVYEGSGLFEHAARHRATAERLRSSRTEAAAST